jgi:hypothetical protein
LAETYRDACDASHYQSAGGYGNVMPTFGSVMSFDELEAAVRRICHQASLPRDAELATMQADIIDHWLRRSRALRVRSEFDEVELIALAASLRFPDLRRLPI